MKDFQKLDISKLTKLSRIHCKEEEEEALSESLSKILAYVEQLQEIDTEQVEPCNHVLETLSNVMREDEVGHVLQREVFLQNAPSHVDGMIRIPPVLK